MRFFHLNLSRRSALTAEKKQVEWLSLQNKVRRCALEFAHDIHALVMMDTHIHLISSSVCYSENYFSECLQRESGQPDPENLIEVIDNYAQFLNTYKYVYRNPVEAGLASKCEDYRYSSLQGLLGRQKPYVIVLDPLGLVQNPFRVLSWLNGNNRYNDTDYLRSERSLI